MLVVVPDVFFFIVYLSYRFCAAGTAFNSTTTECKICSYSKYQDQDDVPDVFCKTCPANTYITDDKKSIISHRALGDCIACAEGKGAAPGQRNCDVCSAGQVRSTLLKQCVDCKVGQFRKDQVACTHCPQGFHNSETGTAYCLPCLPGEHQILSGNSSCNKCPVGFFTTNPSSTNCSRCEQGKHSANTGASFCFECDPGKFSPVAGECVDCPVGFYQESGGKKI